MMKLIVTCLLLVGVWSRTINVQLTAPWPTSALSSVLEISEFMAEEEKFWPFVSSLRHADTTTLLDKVEQVGYTDALHEQVSSLAVDKASEFISPLQLAALRLTLSVRSFAPLIETYRSLASLTSNSCDSNSWVILQPSGRVVCNFDDLETAFDMTQEWKNVIIDPTNDLNIEGTTLEHEYEQSTITGDELKQSDVSATLYSRIGTSAFWQFHDKLSDCYKSNKISKYYLRHSIPNPNTTVTTTLQGYGVNLDIKNMEYMNMDDTHSSNDENNEEKKDENDEKKDDEETYDFPLDEDLNGISFSTLSSRKPELNSKLSKLRNEFLDDLIDNDENDTMKVWKLKELGIQATYDIMKDKDPLQRLKEVSQNFPIYANTLSRIKVDKDMKHEVKEIANSGLMNLLGSGGGAQLFVNGRAVNIGLNTFNLFALIDTIRSETRQLSKLSQLKLPAETSSKLLEIGVKGGQNNGQGGPMGGSQTKVRIDIVSNSKGAITFLNNLEKDVQYKRWPKNLRQLLQPSWSLITLGRNLYTLVLVIDPTTEEGITAVTTINMLYQQMYPVRFGVVLTSSSLVNEFNEFETLSISLPTEENFDETTTATATDVSILFAHAKSSQSSSTAFNFLFALAELSVGYSIDDMISCYVMSISDATGSWSTSGIRETAVGLLTSKPIQKDSTEVATQDQVSAGEGALDIVTNMTRFVSGKGLLVNSFTLNGVPGESLDLQSALMPILGAEQQLLQMMVHEGKLGDNNNGGKKGGKQVATSDEKVKTKSVLSIVMSENNAVPRYHPLVSESPEEMKFLLPSPSLLNSVTYLHAGGTRNAEMKSVSLLFIDDWSKTAGMKRLTSAFSFLNSGSSSAEQARLSVLFSPSQSVDEPTNEGALAIQTLINTIATLEDHRAINFLALLLKSNRDYDINIAFKTKLIESALESSGVSSETCQLIKSTLESCASTINSHQSITDLTSMINSELDVTRDQYDALIVANGRALMIGENEVFTTEDWKLFTDVEVERSQDISALIEQAHYINEIETSSETPQAFNAYREADWRSDAVFVSAAFVGQYTQVTRMDISEILRVVNSQHTLLDLSVEKDSSDIGTVSIVVVVNPLSEAAQRVSPILLVLRDELKLPLKVLFIPDPDMNEFPLSKFYRYVIGTDIGNVFPMAKFSELPKKHVLTMRMDVPEPWNVQSSMSIQDVDNLKCDDKSCGDIVSTSKDSNDMNELTQVEYTLKSLLLAGSCFDPVERRPPNGLQLTLKRVNTPSKQNETQSADTVVMQNLGYFQLQASPGIFDLSLAEGRGSELYYIIDKHDNISSKAESKTIALTSFHDINVPLRVKKYAGKEKFALLDESKNGEDDDEETGGGLFSSFGNMFKSASTTVTSKSSDDDTMHVFSLATGHLYERFLKIMMLSVVKRSSMHVKFWLFENYLSPTFKDSAIAMSQEYGFELGFVSYKWPAWLRQQSSKQRIIWGYKILFLDVLFPLNVKKVIYVDSDQTVRGDLAELWKMDLQGKPYAYTPFCDSRKETLGYQFWRTGYWKDHLRGKPYHISALYVVDLDVFRRKAVGDQLRALYDNLSRDPNSLSNLDQDLPNYAQNMIPIFSLPQEWLWCESWCSDSTKAQAKTIDLCNNPMHKEPKLDMAKRVISGELFHESWIELDDEIKALEQRLRIGSEHEAEEASLDMGFG